MVAASTNVLTVQAPTGVSATLDIYCSQMAKVAEIRVSCFYFLFFNKRGSEVMNSVPSVVAQWNTWKLKTRLVCYHA